MTAASRLDAIPPGETVVVAGRKVRVRCEGNGQPTIILEAGVGSTSAQWAWVQPALAKFTRVISYDRAGLGASETGRGPRDARKIAGELSMLLAATGHAPPYIVVGHSLGGVLARVFAGCYPSEVAALVLIDPTPLDLKIGPMQHIAGAVMVESLPVLQLIGVQPLRAQMGALGQGMPESARAELMADYGTRRHLKAFRDEFRAMGRSIAEAKQMSLSADLPVVVLSADKAMGPGQDALIVRAKDEHRQFAAGFRNGLHRVLPGSSHLSLVTEQGHASLIVAEIRALVARVRTS